MLMSQARESIRTSVVLAITFAGILVLFGDSRHPLTYIHKHPTAYVVIGALAALYVLCAFIAAFSYVGFGRQELPRARPVGKKRPA